MKITPDGQVKVLDFGLAKAVVSNTTGPDLSQSPTLTESGTSEGAILGTAAYMSPEQARGKTIDKRTDIWAYGCVLYEMLTGRKAFAGETASDAIAAILSARARLDEAALQQRPRPCRAYCGVVSKIPTAGCATSVTHALKWTTRCPVRRKLT